MRSLVERAHGALGETSECTAAPEHSAPVDVSEQNAAGRNVGVTSGAGSNGIEEARTDWRRFELLGLDQVAPPLRRSRHLESAHLCFSDMRGFKWIGETGALALEPAYTGAASVTDVIGLTVNDVSGWTPDQVINHRGARSSGPETPTRLRDEPYFRRVAKVGMGDFRRQG